MFKHLLRIDHLSLKQVEAILTLARIIKDKTKRGIAHRTLEGKVLVMIFQKPSAPTRVSFEVGMYQMGGTALFIEHSPDQPGRGENIVDTARVVSRYADGIMLRAFSQEAVEAFAGNATVPVINGLTDQFHPCQILSDLFTIRERLGDPRKQKIVLVGDGSNVVNSWINAAVLMGLDLTVACPEGYEPDQAAKSVLPGNVSLTADPIEAARNATVIYTGAWMNMRGEADAEERKRALEPFQVNDALLKEVSPSAVVMHCLPAQRGLEITDEVMDGPRSVVYDQAENRLHVQKAILELLMGEHKPRSLASEIIT